jgi:hypothetical protein
LSSASFETACLGDVERGGNEPLQKSPSVRVTVKPAKEGYNVMKQNPGRQKFELVKRIELENGYRCRICDMQFQRFESMMQHFAEEHPLEHKFICHICWAEHTAKSLKIHLISQHSSVHAFPRCIYCPQLFVCWEQLTNHVASQHVDIYQLACRVCGIKEQTETDRGKLKGKSHEKDY